MFSTSPPITMRGEGVTQYENLPKFCGGKIFSYICDRKNFYGELKTNGGVISITVLLHVHYLISLETANTQKSEVFLLRISLGNVNASVVASQYPEIYNFIFRKGFLESVFIQDFDHKFYNTFCLDQCHQLYLLLEVSQ